MKDMLCGIDSSIRDALSCIDKNAKGVVFVVDGNDKFVGVVTDGDLRRKILECDSLDFPLVALLREKPESVSASVSANITDLVSLTKPHINIIPLLDSERRVVDYYEWKTDFHAPIAMTELTGDELSNVSECVISNWISSQGKFVTQFEQQFSHYIGMDYGVSVMNGTAALHLALVALGIGPGDEVIVPNLTFAASINTVLHAGATPVLVDVEPDSWCMNPDDIEKVLSPKTRCIMPVHLYGQPCAMTEIMHLADAQGIYVIEDCAEAHGAEYDGTKVGAFGHITCFSFFGNKIVSTGEGGICLTRDPTLDEKLRVLRDHGMSKERKYWHDVVGFNYRMTNLQAAIGVAQLSRIDQILIRREQINQWYGEVLKDLSQFSPQKTLDRRKKVTWLVSYQLEDDSVDRDRLLFDAKDLGMDLRPFFYPLSDMPIYAKYAKYEMPVSKMLSRKGLNFPTVLSMNKDDYREVANRLARLVG